MSLRSRSPTTTVLHEPRAASVKAARHRSRSSSNNYELSVGSNAEFASRTVAWCAVDVLKENPRNPRTHSARQVRAIAESIRAFGFTAPILIDEDGRVLAGHGRLEAARLLGLATVPTLCLAGLSEARKHAYAIADNRIAELAGWDRELLAAELETIVGREDNAAGDHGVEHRRHGDHEPCVIAIPARIRLRGVEMRFVIDAPGAERTPEPDPSLIRVVVRGHDWFRRLLTGEARSLQDIAAAENVTDRYVRRLIDLAFLAPDITAAILDGVHPVDLTAEGITRRVELPLSWSDQRRVLGFA